LLVNKDIKGYQTSDDCSIYPIDDENLLIQSVDFFTPIVDDPYDFGRIAAANSFSDIYAMGGKPVFALNITCFPTDDLPLEVLHQILKGGQDIANNAGTPVLGGHSIKDKEPKYGMVVTGLVKKKQLVRNDNAKVGDSLILTKPIGTGIISTAIKKGIAKKSDINNITEIMTELNDKGANAMNKVGANACTDITGYGLLGHLKEMCESSAVSAILNFKDIPLIDDVTNYASKNIIPGGTKRNFECFKSIAQFDSNINEQEKLILSDAQTSGGLLISVSNEKTDDLIKELKKEQCLSYKVIGQIVDKKTPHLIQVK
tara:strand:- start:4030 stop:4974 length:945 start_codon:yes stop_codon:yes gene_type:complete